jgi:release factor glutamine methyltransferase
VTDVWTIRKLLAWTTEQFKSRHIASSRLDAEILLAYSLKLDRLHLYLDPDRPSSSEELDHFRELVKKRSRRMPVAYLTGVRDFWSLPVHVNRHVLIPRPETEVLVELTAARLKTIAAPCIADIGTGSGCIIMALSRELPDAHFWGVDLSSEALGLARENIAACSADARTTLVNASLMEGFDAALESSFDAVVSNPPYIRSKEIETLAPEIALYEPRMALDGGPDGLSVYPGLASQAIKFLKPGGFLAVEIGSTMGTAVAHILEKSGLRRVEIFKDYSRCDRVVVGYKFSEGV